jgi:hypothetical protein
MGPTANPNIPHRIEESLPLQGIEPSPHPRSQSLYLQK